MTFYIKPHFSLFSPSNRQSSCELSLLVVLCRCLFSADSRYDLLVAIIFAIANATMLFLAGLFLTQPSWSKSLVVSSLLALHLMQFCSIRIQNGRCTICWRRATFRSSLSMYSFLISYPNVGMVVCAGRLGTVIAIKRLRYFHIASRLSTHSHLLVL